MHYTFDIISCMFFVVYLAILWSRKWRVSKRYRAIYALTAVDAVYLASSLYFCFTWHARTGRSIIEPFYEYDTLYFVTLSLALGLLALYFTDTCLPSLPHAEWLVLPLPIAFALYFLFFNRRLGWMFTYARGYYERGPFLWANYVIWILYGAFMVTLLVRNRVKLGLRTFGSLSLFVLFETALQVYQFYFVNFYIGGIAYSAGLLYLIIAPVFLVPRHDELTGLYNRQGFFAVIQDAMRRGLTRQRQVVAVDMLHFKEINEQYGFETGNKVLQAIAARLEKIFAGADAIARFDADHFFVCAPKDKIPLPIPPIDIGECLPESQMNYEISLYEGVYPLGETREDISRICDRATFAVEQIKGDYNKRYAYFDAALEEQMQFQIYMQQEMQEALAQERFLIYYQPVFDIQTMQVVSAEALARWKDKRYGMIGPADFIPLFEKSGFVTDLDLYMSRQVCKNVARWKEEGKHLVPVSVNASRVDILSSSFAKRLDEAAGFYGLVPEDLRIEVTESAFIGMERITDNLETLRRMGYKIMMDDFGSGYSNFNTFASMPVDILKMDMGFMSTLGKSERGQRVFESIAEMARKIDMPMVVEGVETEEQLASLKQIGIRYAQGYYFSKPMSAEEFEQYLR